MRRIIPQIAACLLLGAGSIIAQTLPAEQALADFETPLPAGAKSARSTARIVSGNAPQGKSYLKIDVTAAPNERAYVRLPLPADVPLAGRGGISASLRIPKNTAPAQLRWLALDKQGLPIFQRRFQLPPGEMWVQIDEPFRNWRWDDQRVGDWDEVAELVLRIEGPAAEVDLDDLRVRGTSDAAARTLWLLDLAFGQRPSKHLAGGGMLVATDAVGAFSEADLRYLLDQMLDARAFIQRVFGPAVHPLDDPTPATLLIFADDAGYRAFRERLGAQWRFDIASPPAQGYTIQDISTSTYTQEVGVRRPVYLHESVHAIVARELRLQANCAPQSPIQEGLANYLQLCMYPQSLHRNVYAVNFSKPIDPAGKGLFVPLKSLFSARAELDNYAQLASLVAYLLEKDPQMLQSLARGLAQGRSAQQVLDDRKVDWEQLQDGWMAWGRQRFGPQNPQDERIFEPPVEFR